MSKTKKEQFVEALEHGITHKAMYLLQFMKNKINELYDYRSPLFWASRYGNEKVAQALREMGAVEKVDKEGMGEELLKILGVQSADEIDEKRAIELIKDGANIEKKDTFGQTALIWASRYRRVEVVKTLLSRGAKVDEKDNDGDTALMWASANGHVEVVEALIENGAKVDEKDNKGYTALMRASYSYKRRAEVIKALLDAGAKVDEKNNGGNTAIDLTDDDEIKKMLRKALRKQKMMNVKNKISDFFGR